MDTAHDVLFATEVEMVIASLGRLNRLAVERPIAHHAEGEVRALPLQRPAVELFRKPVFLLHFIDAAMQS